MTTLRSLLLVGGPGDGRRIVYRAFQRPPARILYWALAGSFFYLHERADFYEDVARFTPAIDQADGAI